MEKGRICIKPSFDLTKSYTLCKCGYQYDTTPRCVDLEKEVKKFDYSLSLKGIKMGLASILYSELKSSKVFNLNISPLIRNQISKSDVDGIIKYIENYNSRDSTRGR